LRSTPVKATVADASLFFQLGNVSLKPEDDIANLCSTPIGRNTELDYVAFTVLKGLYSIEDEVVGGCLPLMEPQGFLGIAIDLDR
jgi:hypothetical protein